MDGYIQKTEPFKKLNTDRNGAIHDIRKLIEELATVAFMLQPFMPKTSEKILEAIKNGKEVAPLFPRMA